MSKQILDLDRRVRALERETARLRKGKITASGLVLGGTDGSPAVTGYPYLESASTGDAVAVLTTRNQLLMLGRIR